MIQKSPFRVLVTRPSPQGEVLCSELEKQGYEPVFFPVIEIKPLDPSCFQEQLAKLNQYAFAIFVSRPAVSSAAALLSQQWPVLPKGLKVAAVGEGTAEALKEIPWPVALCPKQWSSEALLALPELQVLSGKKIAIFCAKGGRELLASTLKARGAELSIIYTYERLLPTVSPSLPLLKRPTLQAVVCTSVQGLLNLKKLFTGKGLRLLQKIPLVLISERIMIQARLDGFEACYLAKGPSHSSILQALKTIRNEWMPEEAPLSSPKTIGKNRAPQRLGRVLLILLLGLLFFYLSALNYQVVQALTKIDKNQQQLSEMDVKQADLQKQLQLQAERLKQAAELVLPQNGISRKDYSNILNAEGWVKLASATLLLRNDLPVTLYFMEQAEAELALVEAASAAALKKAVTDDLATLKAEPLVNTADLYLRLAALQAKLGALPVVTVQAKPSELNSPSTKEPGSGPWKRIFETLSQLVVVYHLPAANTPPFITPDLKPYLYQNLSAVLNEASWAVLHRDDSIYHASLKRAQLWLQQYFLPNSPLTQDVLGEVLALQALSIQPIKQDLLVSPQVFQAYLKTMH